jgi:hypothetical protein
VRDGWLSEGWVAKFEGWVAKSVARQLATAALWVRIQISLINHKWATQAKEWPTHSSPPKKKKIKKKKKKKKKNLMPPKCMADKAQTNQAQ